VEIGELVRTMLRYHHDLNDRLWESIGTLTEEKFTVEIEYSHGSIRNQMVHLSSAEARWVRGLEGRPDARRFGYDPLDYASVTRAQELSTATARATLAYVAGLGESDWFAVPPGMSGPVWQVLLHLVNHGTDHRAQVLRALQEFGAPTFDQDLILYLWFGGQRGAS
jgi:uncharacterized damage-inducible protein DinB